MSNAKSKLGTTLAVVLVVVGLGALVWFLHPLWALLGFFLLPSSASTKQAEDAEKAQILAQPANTVVASQPADVRTGVAAAEQSAVDDELARIVATGVGKPVVNVTVSDPR